MVLYPYKWDSVVMGKGLFLCVYSLAVCELKVQQWISQVHFVLLQTETGAHCFIHELSVIKNMFLEPGLQSGKSAKLSVSLA